MIDTVMAAMGTPKVFALIRTKYNTLSASQKEAADYILAHPEEVMYCSLGTLASRLKMSETTILRFLRKIDYSSYQVFKVHIAQEFSGEKGMNLFDEVKEGDSTEQIVDRVIASTAKSIQDSREALSISELDGFVDRIIAARRILIIGVGSSSAVAFDMYHKLLKLGRECSCSSDPHIINIACSNLGSDDLLVCISHSGESHEILSGARKARSGGCPVCSITSFENSALAGLSNRLLISSSVETHYRSDALTSRIIQLTFVDILYVSLAMRLGEPAMESIEKSREAVAQNKR